MFEDRTKRLNERDRGRTGRTVVEQATRELPRQPCNERVRKERTTKIDPEESETTRTRTVIGRRIRERRRELFVKEKKMKEGRRKCLKGALRTAAGCVVRVRSGGPSSSSSSTSTSSNSVASQPLSRKVQGKTRNMRLQSSSSIPLLLHVWQSRGRVARDGQGGGGGCRCDGCNGGWLLLFPN